MAVTLTYEDNVAKPIKRCVMEWVSNSVGAAGTDTKVLSGEIKRVVYKPGSGGSQPSASYDITLNDDQSLDVLAGTGVNLSNTTASQTVPGLTNGTSGDFSPMVVNSPLTLAVANAGDTKSGTVVLYWK